MYGEHARCLQLEEHHDGSLLPPPVQAGARAHPLQLPLVAVLALVLGLVLPRVPDMAAVLAAPALVVAVVACTLGCLYPMRQRALRFCGAEASINNVTFQLLRWTVVVAAPSLLLMSFIDWALVPDIPQT